MTTETPQDQNEADGGQSRAAEGEANLTAVLERPRLGLAEFIEHCGGFELKPYQREIVAAIERGEKLTFRQATKGDQKRAIARMVEEYKERFMRSNVEFSGGAPLHGAASAGTQGYASEAEE